MENHENVNVSYKKLEIEHFQSIPRHHLDILCFPFLKRKWRTDSVLPMNGQPVQSEQTYIPIGQMT